MRRTLPFATAVLLVLVLAPAALAVKYKAEGTIPLQSFYVPVGVSVNQTTHDVYLGIVVGKGFRKLHLDTSEPTNPKWIETSVDSGSGGTFAGVAVVQSSGNVYAESSSEIESTPTPIFTFDPSGNIISGPFKGPNSELQQIATDPSGNIYAAGDSVQVYSPTGTVIQTVACTKCPEGHFGNPEGIAVDSAGNIYVADHGGEVEGVTIPPRVFRFTAAGDAGPAPTVIASGEEQFSVAVDTANNNVFVLGKGSEGNHVTVYDEAGQKIGDLGLGEIVNDYADQLGVDPSNGTVYVSDLTSFSTGGNTVRIYKPVAEPSAVTEAASTVAQSSATLNGTVDPKGVATIGCNFEYTTRALFETEGFKAASFAACEPEPEESAIPVAVSAKLSGLASNTEYRFRVVEQTEGGTAEGNVESFTTLPALPTVSTGGSSSVSQHAATITGTVNPGGVPVTSCSFEYGTTMSYGTVVPCPTAAGEGTSGIGESLGLAGLTPNTTYHYRLAAANAGGPAQGADATFTTPADTCQTNAALCPPPPAKEEAKPSVVAPKITPPTEAPKHKPLTCKKGFKKKKVKGKFRCMKIKAKHPKSKKRGKKH